MKVSKLVSDKFARMVSSVLTKGCITCNKLSLLNISFIHTHKDTYIYERGRDVYMYTDQTYFPKQKCKIISGEIWSIIKTGFIIFSFYILTHTRMMQFCIKLITEQRELKQTNSCFY